MISLHKEFIWGEIFILFSLILYLMISPDIINAIPYIRLDVSRQLVLVFSLILVLVPSLLTLKIKITDKKIAVFLFLRVIYFGILSLFNLQKISHYISYMLIIIVLPIVFFCVQNLNINSKKIIIILIKLSVILIGIQTATAFLKLVIQRHGLYQIKSLIAIPFGNSNTIASIVVFQTILCYYLLKNKFYIVVSTITLLFTISRWGFLSYTIVIVIALILKSNSKNKVRNIIVYFGLIILLYYFLTKLFPSYFSVYSNTILNVYNKNYNNLYNGRDNLFLEYIDLIIQKPFLGYGLGIETPTNGMAHNFLLQSLYYGGIIGTLIYYFPYILMIIKMKKRLEESAVSVLMMLIFVLFLNGFAENVFFTAPSEFISALFISLIYKSISDKGENLSDE